MITHQARNIAFDDLRGGLIEAEAAGRVMRQHSDDGHEIWVYTQQCVYERGWTPITLLARGLILHPESKRIAATPFSKFFNVGEGDQTLPDLSFEVFEKLDGSLIILWHDGARWRTSTKGSFESDQAKAARAFLGKRDVTSLVPGVTYLAEWVSPSNRIVVPYDKDDLVLLAAYDQHGSEVAYQALAEFGAGTGWSVVRRHHYQSVADLLVTAKGLPPSEEGFVVRFENGLRVKIKGDEYRRIHALVSRLTPIGVWEAMLSGDDLDVIRKDLPDEFMGDLDRIAGLLNARIHDIVTAVQREADLVSCLSDKEVGLRLDAFPANVRPFIFPYRKNGGDLLSGRARQALFRHIRPTGNRLDGYEPSFAMNRVVEESL